MATDSERDLRLRRVIDGVVESILEASEEELDEDLRARGEDPDAVAERMRELAEGAVERHRGKERLRRAREQYEARVAAMAEREYDLPESMWEQRQLLDQVFHARPDVAQMVTLQFRDLRGLPDEDVTSCLRQLAELGVLDALRESADGDPADDD